MKKRRYENNGVIIFSFFIVIFLCFCLFINLYICKISNFKMFQGVVYKDRVCLFIVSNQDLKYFYNNSSLYYNDKKYNYSIVRVTKNVLKRNNINYSEILISFKFINHKENDSLSIGVLRERLRGLSLFKTIWEV